MTNFSATECITFGWETFKKRPWFLIGISVLYIVVSAAIGSIENHMHGVMYAIVYLASWVINTLMGITFLSFMLQAHDNVEHASLEKAWKPELFLKYLGAMILFTLTVFAGIILLIVPGVIFALMFSQTLNLVVDRGMGPIEAMKESMRITKGHKGELFKLMILFIGLVIVGFVCVFVGIFVAMPVVALAGIHAYRELSGKADAIVPSTPSPTPPVPTSAA